jgi:hypothetical protein
MPRLRLAARSGKILARRSADDTLTVPATVRGVEVLDALAKERVRSSQHTEASSLETTIKKPSASKERQHQA